MSYAVKTCSACHQVKALPDFGVRRDRLDGRSAKCAECLRARDRVRYPKESARRIERARAWASTPAGKESVAMAVKGWQQRNAAKRATHIVLRGAVRDGQITRPETCEVCSKRARIVGHHDDYSKPLAVRWLCEKCHKNWHKSHEPLGLESSQ